MRGYGKRVFLQVDQGQGETREGLQRWVCEEGRDGKSKSWEEQRWLSRRSRAAQSFPTTTPKTGRYEWNPRRKHSSLLSLLKEAFPNPPCLCWLFQLILSKTHLYAVTALTVNSLIIGTTFLCNPRAQHNSWHKVLNSWLMIAREAASLVGTGEKVQPVRPTNSLLIPNLGQVKRKRGKCPSDPGAGPAYWI